MNPDRAITFDPADNSPMDCQFLLSQLVVPRPIAMVSTRSPEGIANVAPMSYYLPITGDPMLIGITMGLRSFLRTVEAGAYVLPRIPWAEIVAARDGSGTDGT